MAAISIQQSTGETDDDDTVNSSASNAPPANELIVASAPSHATIDIPLPAEEEASRNQSIIDSSASIAPPENVASAHSSDTPIDCPLLARRGVFSSVIHKLIVNYIDVFADNPLHKKTSIYMMVVVVPTFRPPDGFWPNQAHPTLPMVCGWQLRTWLGRPHATG